MSDYKTEKLPPPARPAISRYDDMFVKAQREIPSNPQLKLREFLMVHGSPLATSEERTEVADLFSEAEQIILNLFFQHLYDLKMGQATHIDQIQVQEELMGVRPLFKKAVSSHPELEAFFRELEDDFLEHVDRLTPPDDSYNV